MALIVKKFFNNPFKNTKIIGVSGTNGKTTTTQYIYKVLKNFKKNIASTGTLGIVSDKKVIRTGLTTPLALDTFTNLSKTAKNNSYEYLAMEITSHSSHFHRVSGMDFDLAIFTNLTQDHLDFHLTWDHYKKSKLQYFANLIKQKKPAIVLINKDDSNSPDFLNLFNQETKNIKTYTYGIRDQNADFIAKILTADDNKSNFEIIAKGKFLGEINFQMHGIFNIYNSLAAFCACYLMGYAPEKICHNLEKITSIPGRFEKIPNNKNINIFIDYAHTPDALKNILEALQTIKKQYIANNLKKIQPKLIVVFGCGGERDNRKRPMMGSIAAKMSDLVILTNDNPRGESEMAILQEIYGGIPQNLRNRVELIKDRKKAIIKALKTAKTKDLVLIAGKGHEQYQIIKKKKLYFSDRETVLNFFSNFIQKINSLIAAFFLITKFIGKLE